MVCPHTDIKFWYKYDILVMLNYDAVLRFPGASSGADKEVEEAIDNNIPVFYTTEDLINWTNTYNKERAR